MECIHADWLLCRHCVGELGLKSVPSAPSSHCVPLLCLGRCWAFSEGMVGCRMLGGHAAWKQILSVVPVSAVELLSYGGSCFLYSKGFGMVSLVKSLLLLCQLLSTFLLCFYYKQMNLDFPESELQLLLALQAATGFRLIQAGNTQTVSKERGFSWSRLGFFS